MKNREKFAKEILDIACKGGRIAVTKDNKVVNCGDISCGKCLFYVCGDYGYYCDDDYLERWAESEYVEYVENPTITSREKKFLDILLPKSKYIARDENDKLYVYTEKPERVRCYWGCPSGCYQISDIFGNMFDFIKWKDKEPWLIEDLKKLKVRDDGKAND